MIGENKNSRLTSSYSELPYSSERRRDNDDKAAAAQQVGSAVAAMSSTAWRQRSPESSHFRHVRPRPNGVCAIRRLRKKKIYPVCRFWRAFPSPIHQHGNVKNELISSSFPHKYNKNSIERTAPSSDSVYYPMNSALRNHSILFTWVIFQFIYNSMF